MKIRNAICRRLSRTKDSSRKRSFLFPFTSFLKNFSLPYQVSVLLILLVAVSSGCHPNLEVQNPYKQVDWEKDKRYIANLHTHTTHSDGRLNPQTVVDRYHQLDYDILAITDHDKINWPWNTFTEKEPSSKSFERLNEGELEEDVLAYENRDPEKLGMIAVKGNEFSSGKHHMCSYFTDIRKADTEEEALQATMLKNGLVVFNHPGRYTGRDPNLYNVNWYVDFYKRFDHLVGLEVYNQGDRYPQDRKLWDSILVKLMPQRPVWGFSNDDMHEGIKLGHNWNIFVLPEFTEEWVRRGMEDGRFFYVHAPNGHIGPQLPTISSIKVNPQKITIEIKSTGQDSILWISGGHVVQRGNIVDLKKQPREINYIRAEIYGPGRTIIGTQPFAIRRR
jgi:hypothetical protein